MPLGEGKSLTAPFNGKILQWGVELGTLPRIDFHALNIHTDSEIVEYIQGVELSCNSLGSMDNICRILAFFAVRVF